MVKKVILIILINVLENVWPFLYSFIFVITLLEIIGITNEFVVLLLLQFAIHHIL